MNAQITEISNGYLITVVSGPQQPQGEVLHNVRYIKELHELKGAINEVVEDIERRTRQAKELGNVIALRQNDEAAKVALSQGPRN